MNKDFLKYPEALGLKKVGFDEPCLCSWNLYTNEPNFNGQPSTFSSEDVIQLPTYSQAFRWFRQTYNIDAWVQPFVAENSRGKLYLPDESYSYLIFRDGVFVCDGADFLEPEDAELACLKKLIEIVKTNKNG